MLTEALFLSVTGIGFVFAFLLLLVVTIKAMSRATQAYVQPADNDLTRKQAASIIATIHHHRKRS